MASSRIFVKGLPPTLSEEEFKNHFALKYTVTDAKLIPHRRIGYVGYKNPEEAARAVKYFNKSFIRMSRIGVELARPISDQNLPISRKAQREQARQIQRVEKASRAVTPQGNPMLKRKRGDVDESDPKLNEFLEVMASNPTFKVRKTGAAQALDIAEPPRKIQALELPEVGSDNEYEMVPKKSKKGQELPVSAASAAPIISAAPNSMGKDPGFEETEEAITLRVPATEPDATDDEWLRSRTSRLLDLIDTTDLVGLPTSPIDRSSERLAPRLEDELPVMGTEVLTEQRHISDEVVENKIPFNAPDSTEEAILATGRLFVRNLPYTATEEDLRKQFESYGLLKELHLPLSTDGSSKGFVLIQFEEPAAAVEAYHNVDGEPFQGRLLHVLPAAAKRENKLDEYAIAKLPLKKQKQVKKRAEASTSTFNWNSLYMNQDAINSSIADRLGVSKSELLDPTSAEAGVKQAIAETSIIQETKSYFANNGIDLSAFKKRERGDTSILVKNFPYGMEIDELRKLFEEFGHVLRVLMPPAGTIAIVEYAQAPQARTAFRSLAYRRIKDSVLFLEKAPRDLFTHPSSDELIPTKKVADVPGPKLSAADLLERETELASGDTSTLFVRNLNFKTDSGRLMEIFKPLDGFMSARVNTKTDLKKPGQVLSMGFGFVEFRSKAQAQAAHSAMDGYNLDNHKLVIKASHKGLDAAEERKKDDRAKKLAGTRTKITIKNLPFEASKKDVRTLFSTYGQLRSVRVPKKYDNSTRGFAFADFTTAREAENALEALKDTHLLGRRLVLEFAAENPTDAEEEIGNMQRKVGKQVNKVALQKLIGAGRKKFNIEGDENDADH